MSNDFAVGTLRLLRELQKRGDVREVAPFSDAIARYLLMQMGLSFEEVDEAANVSWEWEGEYSLSDFVDASKLIYNEVKDNDYLKSFIISAMSATSMAASNRGGITDSQSLLIEALQENVLKMNPSRFQQAIKRGVDFFVGFTLVAQEYQDSHLREGS